MATRLLIIEGGEKAAATLTNYFRGTGLAMERVGNPLEALERLTPTPPDLILLHLRHPARDAIEFVKTLRRSPTTRALPVFIITSTYRGARYAEAVRKLGVTTYLETPFSLSELLAAIHRELPAPTTVPMPIHRHLRRAFLSRFSGIHTLHCLSGDKSLVFFEGAPIHLAPGFFHADLGRYLRHRNLISSQENSFFAGAGAQRHEALVQMGCLEYPELLQEKLLYLTEELIAAFGQAPVAATEQIFPCPPGIQPIAVNVPDLFYQGYHRHADLPTFRRQLASLGYRYPGIAANYHRFINFLTLTERERFFLRHLDGARTLRECLVAHPDLEPLILTLSALGMIRFDEVPAAPADRPTFPRRAFFNEPAPDDTEKPLETFVELVDELAAAEIPDPAPPGAEPEPPTADIGRMLEGTQGKNYYELFGMTVETFTPARLRDRYFHYTGQFGPNLLMRLSGEEALSAQEILDRITTAYNTLADSVKRTGYDDLLRQGRNEPGQLAPDRIQAQVQARAGLLHLARKDWERAEQALREACNLEPFNGEWMAHLAWALYRNPVSVSSRARRDKARQTINRALGLERTALGHAYKGWMMLDAGQNPEAGDEFVQALRFDARLELAREGQKILEKKLDQDRRGMFRRMFGIR